MSSRLPIRAVRRFALLGAIGTVSLTVLGTTGDARAQLAGTTTRPLPNVLLLVDSSGSMERMPDNSLPSDNRGAPTPSNICSPGVESTPNRWGMLIQALTGLRAAPYRRPGTASAATGSTYSSPAVTHFPGPGSARRTPTAQKTVLTPTSRIFPAVS